MRIVELVTWVAAVLALFAVGAAGWQLRRARAQAAESAKRLAAARESTTGAERHAERAEQAAQHADSQARWAWEQVKMASDQLRQAKAEHQASADAERWEWAYALTNTARELVDASQELIRIALDAQVAPHYRLAAERHYRQTAQRWQETMIRVLARTDPSLEIQRQVGNFAEVQHRLHGQLGVVLRAAETASLVDGDQSVKQVLAAGQELDVTRRYLQRTVSASLATGNGRPTQQLAGEPAGRPVPAPQAPPGPQAPTAPQARPGPQAPPNPRPGN